MNCCSCPHRDDHHHVPADIIVCVLVCPMLCLCSLFVLCACKESSCLFSWSQPDHRKKLFHVVIFCYCFTNKSNCCVWLFIGVDWSPHPLSDVSVPSLVWLGLHAELLTPLFSPHTPRPGAVTMKHSLALRLHSTCIKTVSRLSRQSHCIVWSTTKQKYFVIFFVCLYCVFVIIDFCGFFAVVFSIILIYIYIYIYI